MQTGRARPQSTLPALRVSVQAPRIVTKPEELLHLDEEVTAFVGNIKFERHKSLEEDRPIQGFVASTAYASKNSSISPKVVVAGNVNIMNGICVAGEGVIDGDLNINADEDKVCICGNGTISGDLEFKAVPLAAQSLPDGFP